MRIDRCLGKCYVSVVCNREKLRIGKSVSGVIDDVCCLLVGR